VSKIKYAINSTGQNHSPQAATKLFSVCHKSQGSLRGSQQPAIGCYLNTQPQSRIVRGFEL